MKRALATILLAMACATASAATSGSGVIRMLQSAYGGWIFSIDHTNNNPESCTKPTMILQPTHAQYKEIYSLLLTAYVTGKPIIVFTNGCDSNGYNVVSMIYSSWNSQ